MATTTSFKQQCPSCEALVPIKDKSLIGRKIDCPKCKYRFVVEAPADEPAEVEEAARPAKKNGKTTAIKNGAPAKAKAKAKGAAKNLDPDDDDSPRPKKKSSAMLFVGIGLAAVAVGFLLMGGLFILYGFGGGDGKQVTSNNQSGGGQTNGGTPDNGDNPPEGDGGKKPVADAPALAASDITNLLPNDTQAVVNLHIDKIMTSSLKKAALGTPGAFNEAQFARVFGFPIDRVSRVVLALNPTKKTVFSVMRTAKPYDRDRLLAGLQLEQQPAIKGLNYFRVKRPLDGLGTVLVRANQPVDQLTLYLPDSQTLVFADAPLMQDFLEKGAKPTHLSKPGDGPAAPAGGNNPGGAIPPGPIGLGGDPRSGGPGPSSGDKRPSGKQRPFAGSPSGDVPPGPGGPGGGSASPEGDTAPPDGAPPAPAGSYLTVKESMKAILDELENSEKPLLLSMVAEKQSHIPDALAARLSEQLSFGPFTSLVTTAVTPLTQQFKEIDLVGVSLIALNEDKASATVLLEGKTESGAKKLGTTLTDLTGKLAPVVGKEVLKLELALGNPTGADLNGPSDGFPGGGPPGFPGGGLPGFPGVGPSGGTGGRVGSGDGRSNAGGGFRPRGKFPPPGGPAGGDFNPPGGVPPGDGQTGDQPKPDGTITISLRDKTVEITVDIDLKEDAYKKIRAALDHQMVQLKGTAALADHRSRVHELAAALMKYVDEKKQFPRGTQFRAPGNRALDYPPEQRLSWMVELLPYLGDGDFKDLPRNPDKSWNDAGDERDLFSNLSLAQTVIPQFIGQAARNAPAYFDYPGASGPVAATHFVAVAGLGLDAADYSAKDPKVAKKLGIFGYDRETKIDEIKDGPENTIALLMIPATLKTPWLAGGGSTVRGISDDPKDGDVVLPFVCVKHEGKDGTYAIMGDGKVRFIAKDINPEVFRALCTINGGEKIGDLDAIAPEVPAPADAVALKNDPRPN